MTFTHFYSDPHFGHKNIIEHCNRPFEDVYDMSTQLIERYNSCVRPGDLVLWLGDCFWHPGRPYARDIMSQLNGRKWLVKGNHDRSAKKMLELGFEVVMDEMYADFPEFNMSALATHKPRRGNQINLHGHTHSTKRFDPDTLGIHLGVDAWGYRPATRSEVLGIMKGLV